MLQTMQAVLVYGMLCSQYTEYLPNDDAAWMVTIIEVGYYIFQGSCNTC
jgi:hypothetical protein